MKFLPSNMRLILASGSPRRQELLKEMGYDFIIRTMEVDEEHDSTLKAEAIAEHLAQKKAQAQRNLLEDGDIILASDTVVWCDGESLAKARTKEEAANMLRKISGKTHQVITAVCLLSNKHEEVFHSTTQVSFADLSDEEILYYVDHYKPFDKAGAYGIQEWIGMWAIESINGSYFNVVGLPTHVIPKRLAKFNV